MKDTDNCILHVIPLRNTNTTLSHHLQFWKKIRPQQTEVDKFSLYTHFLSEVLLFCYGQMICQMLQNTYSFNNLVQPLNSW